MSWVSRSDSALMVLAKPSASSWSQLTSDDSRLVAAALMEVSGVLNSCAIASNNVDLISSLWRAASARAANAACVQAAC